MAEVKVPDMGENIESAEVLRVLVSEGDAVEKEQAVLEVETDKATFEVPSSEAGTIEKIHVKEGDSIEIGQTILTVADGEAQAEPEGEAEPEPEGEAEPEPEPRAKAKAKPEAKAKPARKAKAEPEPETDEGDDEIDAAAAETGLEETEESERDVRERGRKRREDERVADRADTPHPTSPRKREEKTETRTSPPPPLAGEGRGGGADEQRGRPAPAAPATRRLARELGVDLGSIEGSAAGGRITREDVKGSVRTRGDGGAPGGRQELPDFERWGEVERSRMSKLGRTSAARLAAAWATIPHVTQHDLADITELEAARRRYDQGRAEGEPKLTVTALAVKAAVAALREYPSFNSSFDDERGELILKHFYNIGIAVDTEHGLLVPVVHDADRKTTRDIAGELDDLARRARDRKLGSEEMQGATFTITNLGGIGGVGFTPIVNWPEVAILGISRARRELQVDAEGGAEARLMMPLSLSYDHRVINGADAARFARRMAHLLTEPLQLLLEC